MATKRPASESAEVTPTEVNADAATPAAVATDPAPAAPDSSSVTPAAEPVGRRDAGAAASPAQQVVYVEAPKPFIAKGNRGFGVLIALLSTVIFAVLYAVAEIIAEAINHGRSVSTSSPRASTSTRPC